MSKPRDNGWLAQLARASALQAGGHRFESYITHHYTDNKGVNEFYLSSLTSFFVDALENKVWNR